MKANTYIREVEAVFKPNQSEQKVKIRSPEDVYKLFCELEDASQEKLIALHLAADNSVLCFQVVHIGTINSAFCNPADILRTTLLTGATSLIIVHNHPSGDPRPSPSDKGITKTVKKACKLFQIKLFDSIIVGKDRYYSAADESEL